MSLARLYDGKAPWVSTRTPSFAGRNEIAGGVRRYSAFDPCRHGIAATASSAKIGTNSTYALAGGPANSAFAILVGAAGAHVIATPELAILTWPPALILTTPSDATGAASVALAIPNDTGLVGGRAYLQAVAPKGGSFAGSNAVEIVFER